MCVPRPNPKRALRLDPLGMPLTPTIADDVMPARAPTL
jgi:hypothetical protein